MLEKLYGVIEPSGGEGNRLSSVYDVLMPVCILASMIRWR